MNKEKIIKGALLLTLLLAPLGAIALFDWGHDRYYDDYYYRRPRSRYYRDIDKIEDREAQIKDKEVQLKEKELQLREKEAQMKQEATQKARK